jgi:hypothetical protein
MLVQRWTLDLDEQGVLPTKVEKKIDTQFIFQIFLDRQFKRNRYTSVSTWDAISVIFWGDSCPYKPKCNTLSPVPMSVFQNGNSTSGTRVSGSYILILSNNKLFTFSVMTGGDSPASNVKKREKQLQKREEKGKRGEIIRNWNIILSFSKSEVDTTSVITFVTLSLNRLRREEGRVSSETVRVEVVEEEGEVERAIENKEKEKIKVKREKRWSGEKK